jgi:hypothetical protein
MADDLESSAPPPAAPAAPDAAPPPISPRSGHESWPPLTGDTERADPNESLKPTPGSDRSDRGREREPTEAEKEAALPQDPISKANRTRGRYQERIDALVQQRSDAEALYLSERRKAQELEARIASLEGRSAAPRGAPEAPAKPTVDQFETYEEFAEALAGWTADERLRTYLQAQHDVNQRTMQAQAAQAFDERRKEFVKTHPDYDEIVGTSPVTLSDPVADLIRHEPEGPALAYHFAQHPDDAARISSMPPGPAWYALGRLAERLEAPGKTGVASPALRPSPRAPTPLTPVGSSGHRSSEPGELEFGPEYMRRGNAADRERRKVGLR